MPCEACNVQFSVFRRKRCCSDCKRFYCSNCLIAPPPSRGSLTPLCSRCLVFAKRPLLKVDLLQLKPKDLIFFLQSRQISTAGCVEKDELVGLVLTHIQQMDDAHSASCDDASFSGASAGRPFDPAHSFDSLKQSCQNFFSNVSDKVDYFSFETKSAKPNAHNNRRTSCSSSTTPTVHISEQPRVSTREIPTYSSSQIAEAGDATTSIHSEPSNAPNNVNLTLSQSMARSPDSVDCPVGSVTNDSNVSSESQLSNKHSRTDSMAQFISPGVAKRTRNSEQINGCASGCDCSDDELITTFRASTRKQSMTCPDNTAAAAAASNSIAGSASTAVKSSPSLRVDSYGESSGSSFEELGAIGGISDDNKTAAENSTHSSERWQFVNKDISPLELKDGQRHEVPNNATKSITATVLQPKLTKTRSKRVTRRRSDGYIIRRRSHVSEDDSPTSVEGNTPCSSNLNEKSALNGVDEAYNEEGDAASNDMEGVEPFHCKRCGKNRINIKKQIDKMRRYLENSQMTECDIKCELEMFLEYLEKRTKSFDDCSDSETTAESSASGIRDRNYRLLPPADSPSLFFDENEGIHVYAGADNYNTTATDSRFINLENFESLEELENLCVKQLKEVLMLNRIDYKGCCEKQELLERVVRLWKNLKTAPSIDKLQTDELCKICMDAPIECVILECGHMATCTDCGKVLSECPICRQYIVRVVRIFKA